jgi:hypothetical protein
MANFFLIAALAPPWIMAAVMAWTGWLRRRTGAPRWACKVGLALGGGSVLTIAVSLVAAFDAAVHSQHRHGVAVDGTHPDPRWVAAYRESIAEPLQWSALGVLALLGCFAWLLACTWRWHWKESPQECGPTNPYRSKSRV